MGGPHSTFILIILNPSLCQEFPAPPTWSSELLLGGTGVILAGTDLGGQLFPGAMGFCCPATATKPPPDAGDVARWGKASCPDP